MRLKKLVPCLFGLSFLAFSQSDRGTITGTVVDPVNAVVANASPRGGIRPFAGSNLRLSELYERPQRIIVNYGYSPVALTPEEAQRIRSCPD